MSLNHLIQTEAIGDVMLLQLSGGISSLADRGIMEQLNEIRQLRRDIGLNKVIVDLEQAPFFGSSFLEMIRVLWNDVTTDGGSLVLCNASPVGRDVLQIAKFDQIWPIAASREEALESLSASKNVDDWPEALQVLLSNYEQGPSLLCQAISNLTSIQLRLPAPPGAWSVLSIVCHIADFEIVYADRMKRILAEDQPTLLNGDPDKFAAKLAYAQRDLNEEINVITSVRREAARILKTLQAEDFERIGQHSTDGPITIKTLLERIVRHIPHHIQFINGKKASLLGR